MIHSYLHFNANIAVLNDCLSGFVFGVFRNSPLGSLNYDEFVYKLSTLLRVRTNK